MSDSSAAKKIQNDSGDPAKDLLGPIDRYYSKMADQKLSYVPVQIELILVDKIPDIALYIVSTDDSGNPTYKPFRNKGLYLSQVEIDNLVSNNVKHLYIHRDDIPTFTQYVDRLLADSPTHSPMADKKKVTMLRNSAINVMGEVFTNPTPENVQRGVKVVSGFVYLLMRDPKAYKMLLKLSSHDPYTLQHSVGVATNSIILAKKMGIDDEPSLIEVGVGGLLHDIGKTKVPLEIINKKGKLNDEEWAIMKQHSTFGHEVVKDDPNVGTRAKLAILQHHEEPGGTGYPLGLSGNQISYFAKIVSIADIYNAITTDRSYSKALRPFEAFQLIKAKLSHKVDEDLFNNMVKIYGGLED